ncbi:MAG: hypothetical protein AAFU61_08230, partial [Pseudomonadota bacterium]
TPSAVEAGPLRAGRGAGGSARPGPADQANLRARPRLTRKALRLVDTAAEAAESCLSSLADLDAASSALDAVGWNVAALGPQASRAERDGVTLTLNPGSLLCLVQADDMRLEAAQIAGERALKEAFGVDLQLSDFAPSPRGCGARLLEGPRGPVEIAFTAVSAAAGCAPDEAGLILIRSIGGAA